MRQVLEIGAATVTAVPFKYFPDRAGWLIEVCGRQG